LEINGTKRGKRRGKQQIGDNANFCSKISLYQARFAYYILAIALNFCDDVFQKRSAATPWRARRTGGLMRSVAKGGQRCSMPRRET
jgi:hypothetical protein